ncbi:hypothetical protein V6N12_042679 [Hibiscus sabdariffa]|uniref:Uncharacterized protein n=1 Tax=Hibiscus sabdariffa TaxID=183260 RepID=A0ABR2AM73_9ROSI
MNRKDIFDFQKISIRIYVELILSMNRHRVQVKELLDKWWKPVQKTWPSSIFRIGKVWHLQNALWIMISRALLFLLIMQQLSGECKSKRLKSHPLFVQTVDEGDGCATLAVYFQVHASSQSFKILAACGVWTNPKTRFLKILVAGGQIQKPSFKKPDSGFSLLQIYL